MSLRSSRLPTLVMLIAACCGTHAWAQFGGINAEFAGGGARPLAMGGSFIALADDATAAEYNPAGLWQLRRPELAAQLIYAFDEQPLAKRIRVPGVGSIIEHGVDEDEYWIPSFASFVYPTQHLTLAVSDFANVGYDRRYAHPTSGESVHEEAYNRALGLSLAVGLAERLSAGVTLRYNRFRFEYDTPSDSREFEDEAFTYNVGLLWRLNRHFSMGAVYKSAQALKGEYREGMSTLKVDTEIPATLGAGIALLPNDSWRILLDIDHVWWSDFDPNTNDDFVRDDVWRYHVGAEWYAGTWRETAIFLRGGYMYEEPNAFRYTGDNALLDEIVNTERDSIDHLSLGIGFARRDYQVDLGVDLTEDHGIDAIASLVWYF